MTLTEIADTTREHEAVCECGWSSTSATRPGAHMLAAAHTRRRKGHVVTVGDRWPCLVCSATETVR